MPESYDPFSDLQDPNVAVSEPPLPPAPGRPAAPQEQQFDRKQFVVDVLEDIERSPEYQAYKRNRKEAALKEELRQQRQRTADFGESVLGNLLHLKSGDLQLAKIGAIFSGWANRKLGMPEAAAVADRKADEYRQEQKEIRSAIDGLNMGAVARTAGQFGESFIVSSPTLVVPGTAATAAARAGLGVAGASMVGLGAGAGVGGGISGISVYDDARDQYIAQGFSEEEASEMAKYPGWVSGIGTAAITALFGRTGVERSAFLKLPKDKVIGVLRQVFNQAGLEGLEEGADEIYQKITGYLTYHPDMPVEQAISEVGAAFGLGMAMGGGVEILGQIVNMSPPEIKALNEREFPRPQERPKTRKEAEGSPILPASTPKQGQTKPTVKSVQSNEEAARQLWGAMKPEERLKVIGPQGAAAPLPLEAINWEDLTEEEQLKVYDQFNLSVEPVGGRIPATAPAMPTAEDLAENERLTKAMRMSLIGSPEHEAAWAAKEQLKAKYGGHDLTKIGTEVPVAEAAAPAEPTAPGDQAWATRLSPSDSLAVRSAEPIDPTTITSVTKDTNDAGQTVYAIIYDNGKYIGYDDNPAWELHPLFGKKITPAAPAAPAEPGALANHADQVTVPQGIPASENTAYRSLETNPQITVEEFAGMDNEQRANHARSIGLNATGLSYAVGHNATVTENDILLLKTAYDQARARGQQLADESSKRTLTDAELNELSQLGQVENAMAEAIGAATDTGSAGFTLRKLPNYRPNFRGLINEPKRQSNQPEVKAAKNRAVTEVTAQTSDIPTTLATNLPDDQEQLAREQVFKGLKPAEFSPAQAKIYKGRDRANYDKRVLELRALAFIAPTLARGETLVFPDTATLGKIKKNHPGIYRLLQDEISRLTTPPRADTPSQEAAASTPTQDLPKNEDQSNPLSLKEMSKSAVEHFISTLNLLKQAAESKVRSAKHVKKQKSVLAKQGKTLKEFKKVQALHAEALQEVSRIEKRVAGLRSQLAEAAAVAPTAENARSILTTLVSRTQNKLRLARINSQRLQEQHDSLIAQAQAALDAVPVGPASPTTLAKIADLRARAETLGKKKMAQVKTVESLQAEIKEYQRQIEDIKRMPKDAPIDREAIRSQIKDLEARRQRVSEKIPGRAEAMDTLRKRLVDLELQYRKAFLEEVDERSGGKVSEFMQKREAAGAEYRGTSWAIANIRAALATYGYQFDVQPYVRKFVEREVTDPVTGQKAVIKEYTRRIGGTVGAVIAQRLRAGDVEVAEQFEANDFLTIRPVPNFFVREGEEINWPEAAKSFLTLIEKPTEAQKKSAEGVTSSDSFVAWFKENIVPAVMGIQERLSKAEAALTELQNSVSDFGLTKQSTWSYDAKSNEFKWGIDSFLAPDPNYVVWMSEINSRSPLGSDPSSTVVIPPGAGQSLPLEPDFEGEQVKIPHVHPGDRPQTKEGMFNPGKGDVTWQIAYYTQDDDGRMGDTIVVLQRSHHRVFHIVTIKDGVVVEDVRAPQDKTTGRTNYKTAVQAAQSKLKGKIQSAFWTAERGFQIPTVYSLSPLTDGTVPSNVSGQGSVLWTPAVELDSIEDALYRAAAAGELRPGMSKDAISKAVTKAVAGISPWHYSAYKKSFQAQRYWRSQAENIIRNATQDAIMATQIASSGRKPNTEVLARAFGIANPTFTPKKMPKLELAQAEYIRRALSVPRGTTDFQETVEVESTFEVKYPRTTQTRENGSRVVSIELDHPTAPAVLGTPYFRRTTPLVAKQEDSIIITKDGRAYGWFVFTEATTAAEKNNIFATIDGNPSATAYTETVTKRAPRMKMDPADRVEHAEDYLQSRVVQRLEQPTNNPTTQQLAAEAAATVDKLRETKTGRDILQNFLEDARDVRLGRSRFVNNMLRLFNTASFSEQYAVQVDDSTVERYVDVSIPNVMEKTRVLVEANTTNEEAYAAAVSQLVDQMSMAVSPQMLRIFGVSGATYSEMSYEPNLDGYVRLKKGMEAPENRVRIKELNDIADLGKNHPSYKLVKGRFTMGVGYERMAELLAEVGLNPSLLTKPKPGQNVQLEFVGDDGVTKIMHTIATPKTNERVLRRKTKAGKVVETKIPFESVVVGKMFDYYVERIQQIYKRIQDHQVARANMKALVARRLFAEAFRLPIIEGPFKGVLLQAKNQQRNPRHQMLGRAKAVIGAEQAAAGKKAEEEYLPEIDTSGFYEYRLVSNKIWTKAKFETDENVKFQASFIPLGTVLLQVESEGEFHNRQTVSTNAMEAEEVELERKKGETDEEYEERVEMAKLKSRFDVKAVEAFLAVEKQPKTGRHFARIVIRGGTKAKPEWETIYRVDLQKLQNSGLAKPFTKEETKSGKTDGWYINRHAVNNSAWWEVAKPDRRDYLSPEDFANYYPHKLGLLPGDVLAQARWVSMVSEGSDAERIINERVSGLSSTSVGTFNQKITEAAPDTFSATRFNMEDVEGGNLMDWLEENLSKSAKGIEILKRIHSIDPLAELTPEGRDPWQIVRDEILVINGIPIGKDATKTQEQLALADKIEKSLNRVHESRVSGGVQFRGGGRRTRISDVNPDVINKPAIGKAAIRELINTENNGLSPRAKRLANLMLDVLPDTILEDLTFVITPGYEIGNDATVEYTGSFSHAWRIARFVSTSGSVHTAAEELAHAAAMFLPAEHKGAVEEYRQIEIRQALENPTTPEIVKTFLKDMEANGGAFTSEDFMHRRGNQYLLPYYHLINTDEFFAHNMVAATDRKGRTNLQKAVDKAKSIISGFLKGIKKAMRMMNAQRDSYFDELIAKFEAGDFEVTANGGFLHEINKDVDMGAVAVAWTAGQVKRQAETIPVSTAGGPALAFTKAQRGTVIAAGNVEPYTILSALTAKREAQGRKLSAKAKQICLIDNFQEVIETVRNVFKVPIGQFKDTITNLPAVWLKEQTILAASSSVNFIRERMNKVKKARDTWMAKLTSPKFIQDMRKFAKLKIEVLGQEAIAARLEERIKSHLALLRARLADPNLDPNSPLAANAAREIDLYESYMTYSMGIAQKVEQMITALSLTEQGNELLQNPWGNLDPRAVTKAYKDTAPPPEQLQVGNAIIEAAAYFIATEPAIRQLMAAAVYQADPEVANLTDQLTMDMTNMMDELVKAPAGLRAVGKGDDLVNKFMRLIRATQKSTAAETKAKTVMRAQQIKLRKVINRAQMLDEAYEFYQELMADPDWIAYEGEIADLAGALHIPENWKHVGSDPVSGIVKMPLPMTAPKVTTSGTENAYHVVKLHDNLARWEAERVKVQESIDQMTQWLVNNGNDETLDAKYFKSMIKYGQMLLDSSLVNDIQGNHQGGFNFINAIFNKWTAMWEGIARSAPVRAIQNSRIAVRAWSDSMLLMNKWYQKWGDRIATLLHKATDSHSDIVDISDRNKSVYDWFNEVGRELFHLANEGYDPKAGDTLPDAQIEITQDDINCLKEMVTAADEAYEIDVTRGREVIPSRTVTDEFIPGMPYQRRAMKLVQYMLPRTFNKAAMDFTKKWLIEHAGYDADRNNYSFRDMAGATELLDQHWYLLKAFLSDRDLGFTDKKSPLEVGAYPALLEKIRNEEITNVEDFLAALDTFSITEENFDARQQFWKDFFHLQKGIYNKAVTDKSSETDSQRKGVYIPFEQENSFTRGRGQRIAPYAWYNHGFHSTAQTMSFMLNGSSHYLNWVSRSVEDSILVLKDMQDDYQKRIDALEGKREPSKETRKRRLIEETKANRQAMRLNEERIKLEDIDSTIKALRDFRTELQKVFASEGKLLEEETLQWNRFFGLYMGGAISSFRTGIQNMLQSAIGYSSWRLQRLRGGIFSVWPQHAFRLTWDLAQMAPYSAIRAIYDAAPFIGKVHYIKALKEMGMLFSVSNYQKYGLANIPRQVTLTLNELFSDMVQDLADGAWKRGRIYRELAERGLNNPFNTRYHLESVAESFTSLGRITYKETDKPVAAEGPVDWVWKQMWNVLKTTGKGMLGAVDIGMALTIRPFLPRAGDMMANQVAAETVFSAMHAVESSLRHNYLRAKDRGADPRIVGTILPTDVLPRWFRLPRNNLSALSDLKNWFQGAAVDLKGAINDFYDRLDAAGDDPKALGEVRFLDHEQIWNLAQQHLEDVNVATPANRPAIAKRNTINRILFALKGWRWNMFSKIMDMMGGAMMKHESVALRAWEKFGNMYYILSAAAIGGLAGYWLLETLTRAIYLALFGEIRSVRKLEDVSAKPTEVAVGMASIVPFLDTAVNLTFNTQPSKARFSPGSLVDSMMLQVMNYVAGAYNSKDLTYGVDRAVVTLQPTIGKLVMNRMPGATGKIENWNASRLLIRHGEDSWLRESRFGGQMSGMFVTPYTPIADRMVNAAMQNDIGRVQEEYMDGVTQMVMNENIPYEEAQRRMRQMFTSRNPYDRAYKRRLTSMERAQVLNKMDMDDRDRVQAVERKFEAAANAIGANVNFEKQERLFKAGKTAVSRLQAIRKQRRAMLMSNSAARRASINIMDRSRGLLTRGRVLL